MPFRCLKAVVILSVRGLFDGEWLNQLPKGKGGVFLDEHLGALLCYSGRSYTKSVTREGFT